MVEPLSISVMLLILLALFYNFINGWNDAANSVATVISTRVLTPVQAVGLAALMNFIAFLVMPRAVAKMVGQGIVDVSIVSPALILACLISSIFWGGFMTKLGMPISMSHTLIGGLVGAGIAAGGTRVLVADGIIKVFAFLVLAPVIGFVFSSLFAVLLFRGIREHSPSTINRIFGKLQLLSVSWYSIGHGSNDALKAAGIITALLISVGHIDKNAAIPAWVILSSYATIALGTLLGGWSVVRTIGMKLTKLRPVDGFCAESGGGLLLTLTAFLGIPVSTTHVIAGSIAGVGTVKRTRSICWSLMRNIVAAWIITIPATAIGGFVLYKLFGILHVLL